MDNLKFLYVPVMNSRDRVIYALFIVIWIIFNWFFWSWWLDERHIGNITLFTLMTLALLYESSILPSFYIFYLGWMREPKHVEPEPDLRMAMITLCVPAKESIDVISRQLEALVNVKYPHDSFVLDEGNDSKVRSLANNLGVKYFTRKGITKYNQSSPPFMARTKAGNVNAWINTFGNQYDYFTQLDIDHVPCPDYLDRVLGHLQNPEVAWVQAPSIYGNLDQSWTARGSAEQELVLQGPLQRGFFGFSQTPFIIGSHSTYRMSAIIEIGGFQPTRAEDHLNTVVLAGHGYEGVYVAEPIAVGDGPENFETYISQQFAWAYSMIQVLFNYTPLLLKKYTFKQSIQFLFAQSWYTIWSCSMALLFILPAISLLINEPITYMSYFEAMKRYIPLPLIAFTIWFWSRKWFQPKGVGLTWRGLVLYIARWPVVLWALINVLMGVDKPYMITSKGVERGEARPFSLSTHIPYFGLTAIMLLSALYFLAIYGQSSAEGYLFFVLQNSIFMTAIFTVGLFLDIRAMFKEKVVLTQIFKLRYKPLITLFFMLIATITVASAAHPRVVESITWRASPLLLVTLPKEGLLVGAYDPDEGLKDQTYFIEHSFVDWLDSTELRFRIETARQKGRYPMVTLEPWPKGQTENILSDINSGKYDTVIRRNARIVADQIPQGVIIRWGHEMELVDLYPWSVKDANSFIQAYRRVVNIFHEEGATNSQWLWSPAGEYNSFYYYPGDNYVDYVGVTVLSDPVWDSLVTGKEQPRYLDYAQKKFWVASYFQKPLIVAEVGISNPNPLVRRNWLTSAVDTASKFNVHALVYFNDENIHPFGTDEYFPDWRINNEIWNSVFSTYTH